jgi:hypothetical protein
MRQSGEAGARFEALAGLFELAQPLQSQPLVEERFSAPLVSALFSRIYVRLAA